ncbi:MAG: hypothetical protein JXA95_06170 [Spirochaetales bacterium]|nr:hypothetical protein [Spirochaetales bacterium]
MDSEQIEYINGSRYSRQYNGQQPTENVAHMGVGDNRVTTVYLTDYLGVAQGMAKNYQDNKILFQEEMDKEEPQTINSVDFSDISFAEYNTIAELTHSLCHVDGFERRHKKHVKYDQLQQWRQTLLDRMKPMIDLYSQSAAMFLPWSFTRRYRGEISSRGFLRIPYPNWILLRTRGIISILKISADGSMKRTGLPFASTSPVKGPWVFQKSFPLSVRLFP